MCFSNAFEGNTLTIGKTKILFENGITFVAKTETETEKDFIRSIGSEIPDLKKMPEIEEQEH